MSAFHEIRRGVWELAINQFAGANGLDAKHLLACAPFQCNGEVFRLQHDPRLDLHGLVLLFELGEIPGATAHEVHLRMLGHCASTAAVLTGFYAVLPGTNMGAYCMRLDARTPGDLVALIANVAESLANNVQQLRDGLMRMAGTLMSGAAA